MLSLASSLAFLVMGVLAMFAGRFSDRYGPLWVLRLSALCTGIGYMLLYFLSAPWQLYLVFGVFVGLGLATHDVVTLSVVARHFEKRRGTMTGVVKVGTAIGQMSVPVVATWLILQFDWRIAFLALGAAATVLLFIAAQLMAVRPKRVASQADGQTLRHGLDFASARRTRQFWTLCAIQFCFFPSLMSIPIHIFVHGTDLGLDARVAATVISTIAGCSIAGRLTVGNLIDRIGARNALLICFVPLLCCLLFLLWISEPKLLFAFAAIYGFSHGGLFTVVSPTIAEFFGMRAHGSVFGTVLFFGTLGGAAGPVVCGWIYDSSGSYSLAFSILAALALTGLLLVLSLKPVSRSSETLQAN